MGTENLDKVIAVLKYLKLSPDIKSYFGRFIIQKVTFLAQVIGIKTNYVFTIYVAGPYSPALAHDYYGNQDKVASLRSDYLLSKNEIDKLEKLKRNIDLFKDSNSFSLLESTATASYFLHQNPNITDGDLILQIKKIKPYLSDENIILGINRAKSLLFKPEYLTKRLREELDTWDKVDN